MGDLDVLLVHPVVTRRGRPIHVILPLGLFSLTHSLREAGFETEILNLGVERLLNPNFHLGDYVKQRNPKVVGIDLHWYVHSYVAVEAARTIKEQTSPLTVLGGFTASYFAEEIMRNFPFIDVVLRGEAEGPMVELVKQYTVNQDYANTPNSTVRYGSKILHNKLSYLAEEVPPNCEVDFLVNWEKYLSVRLMWDPSPYAFFDPKMPRSIDLCVSRGCPYQCSYCGGGHEAHQLISGRENVSFKSPERVVDEIMYLKEKGLEEVRIPYVGCPDYYLKLFSLIRRENPGLSCRISLWNMPPQEVLEKAHEAFQLVSVDISPDSGSENVRRLNKGSYYSNDQLINTVKFLETRKSPVDLYFTVGLPWEEQNDFEATGKLAEKLIRENDNIANAYSFGVSAEPASPICQDPDRYDMILSRTRFMDYYELWKDVEADSRSGDPLGLRRKDLPQASIIEMRRKLQQTMKNALARN